MPDSLSLYRKYRSQTFAELVGQEPVVRTLMNAISLGRISHAYLFTGPRGVGKTSAARLLARAANCTGEAGERPCNNCPNCLAANRDIATDLIEIDAASNTGVDNVREIIEKAQFAPSIWHTKFYIIDEVHMLSASAFNALLKTLEEPPPHTSFILATTEVHKVPATVLSRCQRFDFRRIPLTSMVERLQYICEQEGIEAEHPALEMVARHSTGSLRDAESLMDQLRVYAEEGITLATVQELLGAAGGEKVAEFIDALASRDPAQGLRYINQVLEEGLDLRQFNRQIVEQLRSMLLLKAGAAGSDDSLLDVTEEMKARLTTQATKVTMPELLRWTRIFADADIALRSTSYRQLPLEMALVSAILQPEEAATPPAKDRAAEVAAGIDQIGLPPRIRPAITAPQNGPSAPPPINRELGAINKNANGHPIEPAPQQPADSLADSGVHPKSDGLTERASVPAPSLESSADGDDLPRLHELWPALIDQINARSKQMAAVFRNSDMVRPLSVAGGLCTIGFRDSFHAKRSQEVVQRELIEGALSRVLGYSCRIESVTFAEAASGGAGAANGEPDLSSTAKKKVTREKPSPYETTRGRAALNIFGITKFDDTE
ncbi:MAG: DNA polymerase III subunit gamma/tau [Chloroflexi bacterium]|nr:DNA polymerase III subunit gamma/tau [Chloroflexota bacterium]